MLSEVYPLYANKISYRGFSYVWQGESWPNIIPEAIQYVHSAEYMKKIKSFAGKSNISPDKQKMYEEIKQKRKKGLKRQEVYKEYSHLYSESGFNKIWYKK